MLEKSCYLDGYYVLMAALFISICIYGVIDNMKTLRKSSNRVDKVKSLFFICFIIVSFILVLYLFSLIR